MIRRDITIDGTLVLVLKLELQIHHGENNSIVYFDWYDWRKLKSDERV